MGKTFRDQVRDLNSDLKRDLERLQIKERKSFHRSTAVHGKVGRMANRNDRRNTKIALRREMW